MNKNGADESTGYGFSNAEPRRDRPESVWREIPVDMQWRILDQPAASVEPEIKPVRGSSYRQQPREQRRPSSSVPPTQPLRRKSKDAKTSSQAGNIEAARPSGSAPIIDPAAAADAPAPSISNPDAWTHLEERLLKNVVGRHLDKVMAGKRPQMSKQKLWEQLSSDSETRFNVKKDGRSYYRIWMRKLRAQNGMDEREIAIDPMER